jgi:sensor domain CHASE-containing protein
MNIFQKIFSIKAKIVIITLANVVVLILFVYIISTLIISESYLNIEKDNITQNLQRVDSTVENNISQLTLKLADWSAWDDTYKFIQDKNREYIKTNLQNSSFTIIKVNAIVFVNTKNEIVFRKMVDYNSSEEISSDSLVSYITSHDKLTKLENVDSSVSGIILLPEGPFFIASKPILTSNTLGPIRGSVIFGKFLDNNEIDSIGKLTQTSVNFFNLNSSPLPDDISVAKSKLSKENPYFINVVSQNSIAGYKLIYDLDGNPILIMKIDASRQIYNQSQSSLFMFIIVTSASIVFFSLILIFLLQKLIISRLVTIGKEVEKISKTENLSFRIKEGKKDEVGNLAVVINQMLDTVESSKKIEKDVLMKMQNIEGELRDRLVETERMNKLMVDRELKMVELKKEIDELKKE